MFWIIQNGVRMWLVDVPKSIGKDAMKYHAMFQEYVYNPENGFYLYVDAYGVKQDEPCGVGYGIEDFIEWINSTILKDSEEKVTVVSDDDEKVWELSIKEEYHLRF